MRKLLIVMISAAAALAVQSCDEVGGFEMGSEAVPWRQHTEIEMPSAGGDVDFAFTTRAAWQAYSDDTSMLVVKSGSSGVKGRGDMTLGVIANTAGTPRTAHIIIEVEGYEPEVLVTVTQTDESHADYKVNSEYTDAALSKYYLWNDEYNTLTRNFGQAYDEFLENTLLSMKTNGEDGGINQDGSRYLYSHMERWPVSSAASRAAVVKQSEPTTGIVQIQPVTVIDQEGRMVQYDSYVLGVYPDSPADKAGLRRGSRICKFEGKAVTTEEGLTEMFNRLVLPSGSDRMTLTVYDGDDAGATRDVTLTTSSMALNPVLHSEVLEGGGTKIGYLVYSEFEASFDDELLEAVRGFQSAGIGELVLDLRLNIGGHVISAQMLSSIIAGANGDGKSCIKYEYNPTRMAEMGYSFPDNMYRYDFGPDGGGKGVTLSKYSRADYLSLQRVYILVTGSTASASELTFTALRGIDFPVTLIGERTEGKNVGMEVMSFKCDGYEYEMAPITFKYYNAKNVSCDPAGTEPDYEVDEWTDGGRTFYGWGDARDPLLAKALGLITGEASAAVSRAAAGDAGEGSREILMPAMRRPGRGVVDAVNYGERR